MKTYMFVGYDLDNAAKFTRTTIQALGIKSYYIIQSFPNGIDSWNARNTILESFAKTFPYFNLRDGIVTEL